MIVIPPDVAGLLAEAALVWLAGAALGLILLWLWRDDDSGDFWEDWRP